MVKTLRIAVLGALVLVSGLGARLVHGQEERQVAGVGTGQVVVDPATFERLRESSGAITAVRLGPGGESEPFEIATAVSPRGGELTVDGMIVRADRYSLHLTTRAIEAEGNVVVTTTREDGSMVTLRTDRMTIEEGQ